jgi:hypothetical protein
VGFFSPDRQVMDAKRRNDSGGQKPGVGERECGACDEQQIAEIDRIRDMAKGPLVTSAVAARLGRMFALCRRIEIMADRSKPTPATMPAMPMASAGRWCHHSPPIG